MRGINGSGGEGGRMEKGMVVDGVVKSAWGCTTEAPFFNRGYGNVIDSTSCTWLMLLTKKF
jgi:hypothetical protein